MGEGQRAAVAANCACPVEQLQSFLIESFLELLLAPLGDATPKLTDASTAQEVAMQSELYWRCAGAVVQMPLGALKGLVRHHADLSPFLAADDAPEPEQRIALVRAILVRALPELELSVASRAVCVCVLRHRPSSERARTAPTAAAAVCDGLRHTGGGGERRASKGRDPGVALVVWLAVALVV